MAEHEETARRRIRRTRDLRNPDSIRIGGRNCACCRPSGNLDWRMQQVVAAVAVGRLFGLFAACAEVARGR